MAKAKKLPSGNWRVRAKCNGVTKSFTAENKKDAERLAILWQSSHPLKHTDMTLSDKMDMYINSRRNIISPVTVKTYEGYKRRYLAELQQMPVSKITLSDLQCAFNDLSASLSPKSVKSIFGFVKSVMGEDMPKGNVVLPKIYKNTYNTPDIETGRKILEMVKGTDIELPVTLALRCGLRISEVCGLKWSAVHPDHITIDTVIVTFGAEQIEKNPKSAAGKRKIPITPDIYTLIQSQPHINEYVYQKKANALRAAFTRLLKKNNISHVKFHELRHAFASNMALLGIPEPYAMAIGGWETSAILHNIYEQIYENNHEEFSKKILSVYD